MIRDIQFYGYNETIITPLGVMLTITMAVLILIVKKEYAVIPLLFIALFITNRQRIVVAGLDFNMLRIVVISGFLRIFLRNEGTNLIINKLDKVFIAWSISFAFFSIIREHSFSTFIGQLGNWVDMIGAYLLVRTLMVNKSSLGYVLKAIAIFSTIIACFMIYEQITRHNLFSVFGGVRDITWLRAGKLRSQGSFSHAIMAGSYGASIFPLMIFLYSSQKNGSGIKVLPLVGIFSSIIICITSNSSGPLISLMAGIFALMLWNRPKTIRAVKSLSLLSIPIIDILIPGRFWRILGMIDLTGGSTGSHRYRLLDAAVKNFKEWVLVGVSSTAHWGWGLQDLTNQYLVQAVNGGIITLLLYIYVQVLFFKVISNGLKIHDGIVNFQLWCIGSVMFIHIVEFIGVSYFGQMKFFYILIFPILFASLDNQYDEQMDSNKFKKLNNLLY